MILCCRPSFVIPVRRFLGITSCQRCHFSTYSIPLSTQSYVSHKFKQRPYLVENSLSSHSFIYLASYHTSHSNILLEANRKSCCQNYQIIRHHANEVQKNEETSEKKLSLFQRLKQMFKEYWYVVVPVHVITSSIWFGSFYYLVKSGVDITELLQTLGAGEALIEKLHKSNMGYFAIASAMYKIASPARYAVTLGGTTVSIKYLKDWGYIKPIPPAEKIKEIIDEKKDVLREKRENIKEFYKDRLKKKDES